MKAQRRRQHRQPLTLTNLPPLIMMETSLLLHVSTHLPQSEESEEQPGVHGFVLHSSDKKPLHFLLHSWEPTLTVATKMVLSVVRSRLNAADEG